MTRRKRVGSGLGSDGDRPLAALAQQAQDRWRQIVEPERRRADAVTHLDQPRQDLFDLRMIAQRDRDQTDAIE